MRKMKRGQKRMMWVAACVLMCAVAAALFYFGVLKFNNPLRAQYPVRGVDVSSYQGEIDWEVLSRQQIAFAFIKATEGSAFVDAHFAKNYENALQTGLRAGAYHFFSFDSPGETQAEHFMSQAPKTEGALPPVVDFEFYAGKEQNRPNAEEARENLDEVYDIWIRSIFTAPKPLENQTWTFWQYTNREHMDGYSGREYYIDMNVFNGTIDEHGYPLD